MEDEDDPKIVYKVGPEPPLYIADWGHFTPVSRVMGLYFKKLVLRPTSQTIPTSSRRTELGNQPLRYYTLLSTGYGMAYLNQRAYDERPIYATRTFGSKKIQLKIDILP